LEVNVGVTSDHIPWVPLGLVVRDAQLELEALLDTGFDGDLVVPEYLLRDVGAPDGYQRWMLADGSRVRSLSYLGVVRVGSLGPVPVVVSVVGSEPLVGRSLSDRFSIWLDHGRRLVIEA
jgi:predicted aspartyl protease